MRFGRSGLWQDSDFLKFRGGQTISVFGDQISYVAIPLTMWGVMPLGGLAGGILGEAIGLRETVVVVIGGEVLAGVVYVLSPVSRIREQPQPDEVSA